MADYKVFDLQVVDYDKAYTFQMECVRKALEDGEQSLILCEHPLVLTMGRLASSQHLLFSECEMNEKGVKIHHIDRGGEVTLHTQGQLVVYSILNLNNFKKDLHFYMHQLEEVVIDLLGHFDILARREKGNTGVWVGSDKLASIGIGVKKWVTFHGIGINVNTRLEDFRLIRPCGLDVKMTSLEKLKEQSMNMDDVKDKLVSSFNKIFDTQFIKES